MFLAINELRKEKTRFVLIIFVIVLVSYLTFFLTSLAYGLATSYTQGIDKWDARAIALSENSNNTIERSLIFGDTLSDLSSDNTAHLGVSAGTIEQEGTEDVSIFGIEWGEFLEPNITEGKNPEKNNEVIVSDELQALGIEVGDKLTFKGSEEELKVTGFTDQATFQTSPIIYVDIVKWRDIASELSGMTGMRDDTTVSALVVRGEGDLDKYNTDETTATLIEDFKFGLPGYQAQVLTFSLMIGFLIAIASFVLAVFMYILTLQKKSIFGVLKAEGVPNGYVSLSVMTQIIILSLIGLSIGLILTIISGALLGSVVPFLINPWFFIGIIMLFILCAAIGGIASVRAVTKIDPVEAIE